MRSLLSVVFIVGISISFFSCSKSSDNKTTAPTITLSAKINGTLWQANVISTSKQTSSPIETTIIGEDTATAKSIKLYLFDYNNTTGTFNADASAARAAWNSSYSNSGQIIVTSTDAGYIKGTFNFVTADSTNVTEGTFTAQLP